MTRDTAERARELAGVCRAAIFGPGILANGDPSQQRVFDIERMAIALTPLLTQVQAEARERLATWMIERSFSTGHGDTFEDLLKELDWQVKEMRGRARLEGLKEAFNLRPHLAKEWDSAQFREGYYSGLEAFRQAIQAALAQALQLEEKEGKR